MNPSSQHEKRTRWLALWHRLDSVRFDPLPGAEEVSQVLAALPPRRQDEALADWLARAGRPSAVSAPRRGVVLPFRRIRLRKLAEIRLKAAATELYALPEQPIETADPPFRLSLSQAEAGIRVYLEALGASIDRYAGHYVGIADSEDPDSLVVALRLDDDGEGEAVVDDNEATRQVLCVKPVIVLIESGDA